MINIRIPKTKSKKFIENFFIKRDLNEIVKLARQKKKTQTNL